MAQLKDTVVQGSLRVTDSIFTNSLAASDLITARALEITDQNAISHITLPRDTYNYMSVPSGGELVLTSGTIMGTEYGIRIKVINNPKVTGGYISPGVTNKMTLGDSNLKWSNVYSTTFTGSLSGNAGSSTQIYATNTTPTANTTYYATFVNGNGNGNKDLLINDLFRIYIAKSNGSAYLNVGNTSHVGGVTIHDGQGTANRYGNLSVTTLSTTRTYTFPDATGKVPVMSDTPADNVIPRYDGAAGAMQTSRMSIDDSGTITLSASDRYPWSFTIKNNAGTQVGEAYFDTGNATNYTLGRYAFRQWSPKTTSDTGTSGYHETYYLPPATAGLTASTTYAIHTTKDFGNGRVFYGTCATDGATAVKQVVCKEYDALTIGDLLIVTFNNLNSATAANLQIQIVNAATNPTVTTDAKNIKCQVAASVGNLPANGYLAAGYQYMFIYNGTYWVMMNVNRDNNDNTVGYLIRYNNGTYNIATNNTLYRYQILFQKDETTLIPACKTSSTTATNKTTISSQPFLINGIYGYYSATNTVNAAAAVAVGSMWTQYPLDLRYSFNTGSTLTTNKDVYLVAIPQEDGIHAKLRNPTAIGANGSAQSSGANAGPISQTLPSSDDGYIYIKLGHAHSTTGMTLTSDHPVYWFKNGYIQPYNGQRGLTLTSQASAYNVKNLIISKTDNTKMCRIGANTVGDMGIFSYGSMVFRSMVADAADSSGFTKGIIFNSTGFSPVSGTSEQLGTTSERWTHLFTKIINVSTDSYGAALPTSELIPGRIFFQTSSTEYELPAGGDIGSFLIKNSAADRDVIWGNTISNLTVDTSITAYGNIIGAKVFNAVWNDYAECRSSWVEEPGRVIVESKNGTMELATERLMAGCKIISDTYGNLMGQSKTARTPIAVAGRVLAYTYQAREKYELGTAVCSGPNGTVDIMTREEIREYPERILGTVSEIPDYDIWYAGNEQNPTPIQVNGRIWIYVR